MAEVAAPAEAAARDVAMPEPAEAGAAALAEAAARNASSAEVPG